MVNVVTIFTGDLVGSTKVGPQAVDAAMTVLQASAQTLSDWAGADTRFTRFRGDGWQIYLESPGLALRGALMLVARLRSADLGLSTRIAAGTGAVDRIGTSDLSDASGDAFVISGHALDAMPRNRRLVIEGRDHVPDWQAAIFQLVDWQADRWSPAQAQAVVSALNPALTQTWAETAQHLGITRQALQARLKGAGFDALEGCLRAFECHDYGKALP